jgi:hypothetical protein
LLRKQLFAYARVVMVFDGKRTKRGEAKADFSKYDMAAVASYVRKHINYQANSRYDGIRSILNLDKEFVLHSVSDPSKVVANVSLRTILYTLMKTPDGLPFL